jgi:hypothetical protein
MPEKVERAVFKIFIRGTIEAVWREITKTDSAQQCFFNMCLHTPGLRVGAPIQMRTRSNKYVGVIGKVLEFDPPKRYAHTFRFTSMNDPECKVLYELTEVPGGVEFVMTLEDLPAGTKTAKEMTRGGTMIINTLKAIVENGRPSVGTRMIFGIIRLTEPFSPKVCRVENWPLQNP